VDHPEDVAGDDFAWLSVAWYWIQPHPHDGVTFLNDAADAGNVLTATHMVNGGEHGLETRRFDHKKASELGNELMTQDELSKFIDRRLRALMFGSDELHLNEPLLFGKDGNGLDDRLKDHNNRLRAFETAASTSSGARTVALHRLRPIAGKEGVRVYRPPCAAGRRDHAMTECGTESQGEAGAHVVLHLLDRFELVDAGVAVPLSLSAQGIVPFVALRGPVARTVAAGTLWPDGTDDQAKARLRTAVWRANRLVAGLLVTERAGIWLAPSASTVRTSRGEPRRC
jgi:hypothetical protein